MESSTFTEEGPSPEPKRARMFSLRIVHLDYYMAAPLPGMDECYSHFQGRGVNQVPIVRIFGSTTSGQKTCLHLHKAFPYFYVSYDGDLPQEVNEALAYVRRLASALEKACKIASTMGAKRQHLHSCSLVRGRKYYGYHPNEQLFIKLVLYYPQEVSRISTLLLSGGIMNHKFQPYESHIPYLLQILIDYNLYGMGHLHVSNLKFRNPLPQGPTNLTSLVKQVKAEFLYKTTAPAVEDKPNSRETDVQKEHVDPVSGLSMQQQKKELSSICPGVEVVPYSSQPTKSVETQQDRWLQGNIPGEWIWPVHASSQGRQGLYCRQSTCELEADTSVVEILNRSELLFRPLQQTGSEVKMVQSLAPIWEEELLRTGDRGPAGPVNVQCQPTKRTVVPASSLEDAMRDALSKIANAEDHQVQPTSGTQDVIQHSDSDTKWGKTAEEPLLQNLDYGSMVSSSVSGDLYSVSLVGNKVLGDQNLVSSLQRAAGSFSGQGSLLQFTQVANGEVALDFPEFDNTLQKAGLADGKEGIAINQDAIFSHLSQRLQSQELDNEAAELLRWLGASQDAEDEIHEQKAVEVALSQMFSSPGMDSALLKALSDYESATEQECQAILDCMAVDKEEEEEEEQVFNDENIKRWGQAHDNRGKEGIAGSSGSKTFVGETHAKGKLRTDEKNYNPAVIPQTDGPGDDDVEDEVDHEQLFSPSKYRKIGHATAQHKQLDDGAGEILQRLSAEDNQEVSLREMMMRRRKRRPRKNERLSSPSFLVEDSAEGIEHESIRKRSASVSRQPEVCVESRKNLGGNLDDQFVQVESRRKSGLLATTTSRNISNKSGREKTKSSSVADKKNRPKSSKYTALPMVRVNVEDSKLVAPTKAASEREKGKCVGESYEDVANTEQPGDFDSVPYVVESSARHLLKSNLERNENSGHQDKFGGTLSGDDRDCGGGDGTITLAGREIGHAGNDDVSVEKWGVGTSSVAISQSSQMDSLHGIKEEHLSRTQGVEVEVTCVQSRKDNELQSTQNVVASQSNCRGTLEPPSTCDDDFSETKEFVGLGRGITEPVTHILVQATQSTSELKQRGPIDDKSRYHDAVVLGRMPGIIDRTGQSESLDVDAGHPTQYVFTDMSDESQESFDSAGRNQVRELNWSEPFFGDTGQEETLDVRVHEERRSAALRDNSDVVPLAIWNEKASPSQEQIAVGFTDQEDFGLRLTAAKREVVPGEKYSGCSTKARFSNGPSMYPGVVQSLPSESAGQFFQSTSSRHLKISQTVHRDSLPNILSEVNAKARQEDNEAFSSLPVAVEDGHDQPSLVDSVVNTSISGSDDMSDIAQKEGATCDGSLGQPSHGKPLWKVSPGPLFLVDEGEELYPLVFHQRPPDRGQVLATYREQVASYFKEGDVYYGNVKDVSGRPTVMAGLIFDVKSRHAVHLRPFEFGGLSKRSKFEQGSKCRQYMEQEYWGADDEMDAVVGIPSHFENDGRASYLITPAKPPPTPFAVRQWVSSASAGARKVDGAHVGRGEQMFTMDVNTGKLVPLVEIASAKNSQESQQGVDRSMDCAPDYERPASPKYNESYVLNLTALPTCVHSQRKPGERLRNEPSVAAVAEKAVPEYELDRPLVPSPVRSSGQQQPVLPAEDSTMEERVNGAISVVPGSNPPQEQQNKQSPGRKVPESRRQWRDVSQMTAISPPGRPTPLSQAGFRDPASLGGGQQTTLMSIEVFAETRGDLLPDPRYDAIGCIVVAICEDGGKANGVNLIVVLIRDEDAHASARYLDGIRGCEVVYLSDEADLLNCFARLVRICDPDMLIGWEIQGHSLGLLAERASNLGIGLLKQLSRLPPLPTSPSTEAGEKEIALEDVSGLFDKLPLETKGGDEPIIEDEWGRTQGSGLYVGGRIVLNLWRIMRGEVKLGIYTLEAVADAVLRRKVPRIPWRALTRWFQEGPGAGRFRCLEYFIDRTKLNFQIMEQLDLMNRTAELARVFGIDFYSVFSRGSQYRVESMMARLAHSQNYILVSPTRQQVADQPAMECLPLVMEPESRFYTSPVIVLDFQSLYPSMIIAYNLCFSTCLGKLVPDNPKVLGVSKLSMQPGLLDSLKDCMTITPNGVMFVPNEVRPGVLPRLLQEILATRIMVKKAMKQLDPDQKVLQRVLNARQFALKLIANVTYGYTAAGFSGRMPCAEIADSIVQCGRLTLERAIHLVNSHPRWGGRVVYGDTDSMFVLLEGRSREEAHAIGQEIAAAVTEMNPSPVTLKMEKVYHPCVLLTKKRYVGYSYESPTQLKPTFDAKGIETIRRDSCPAVAKTLEHSLRTLFESQDLSQVKHYLQRQWGKILSGRVSIQDFIFAKEVRLGTYSSRSPVLPPAAIVASKAMAIDPRAEPRYAERIPYVVVHGEPGARLVDMVVDPLTLIDEPSLRLHDTYYITKQIIPACQRIFMLVGVDLKAWFSEMPRVYRPPVSKRVSTLAVGTRSTKWDPELGTKKAKAGRGGLKHGTIDQYYLSRHCTICGEFTRASQNLCSSCSQSPGVAAVLLPGRTSRLERELKHLQALCRHCGGGDGSPEGRVACISLDCSVLFERRKVHRELQAAGAVALDLGYYPPCLPELF